MEINTLRLLVEVSRLGSFAAVSRIRDVDPSAISRLVGQAERELGVRIFQRTTRRLSLTEAGDAFIRRIAPVVEEYDRAVDAASDEQLHLTGTIRVTTSTAYGHTCLLPLLGDFRNAFPNLQVELILSDANLDLVADRIDLGIRLGPTVQGDLVCAKLHDTHYRVCASPDYLAAAAPLKEPKDLTDHQSLQFAIGDFRTSWTFRRRGGRLTDVPIRGSLVISNALSLRAAALAGLGPVLLADWLIDDDIRSGRLIDAFPTYDVTATSFDTAAWLVYPSRTFLPARVRQTIDFLRGRLGT